MHVDNYSRSYERNRCVSVCASTTVQMGTPGQAAGVPPALSRGKGLGHPRVCGLPSDRGRVPDARHVVSGPGRSGPILQEHPQKSKTDVHLSNDLERRPLKGRPNRPRGYPSGAELLR